MIKTVKEGLKIFKQELKELINLERSLEAAGGPVFPSLIRSEIKSQRARIEAMKKVLKLSDEEVEKIKKKLSQK